MNNRIKEIVLHKMRYHFFEADGDNPADWELFPEGTQCDTCIDVAIVRQDKLDELQEDNDALREMLKTVLSESYDGPLHDDYRKLARDLLKNK